MLTEVITEKRNISSLALLLAAALLLPVTAMGGEEDSFGDRNDPRNPQRVVPENPVNTLAPQRISRAQAMNIASSRYEGKVLSILLDNRTNNWRVRMDRDGTVFNVFVNAASGDVNASSD